MDPLEEWLGSLKLREFLPLFEENHIDLQSLRLLTEADLKEIGLPLGPRKVVAAAITELQQTPRSERRFVTTFFGDLVGSSEMARTLDPEDYETVLGNFRDDVLRVIPSFGGHVADFAGDGVVAYFGWPHATEKQTEQALRAALALQAATRDVGIRIGIASGEVFAGRTKIGASQERLVVSGEAPNRAARLQAAADPGQIFLDDPTHKLIGGRFEVAAEEPVIAKGFDHPLPCWRLVAEKDRQTEHDRAPTTQKLVGRENELNALMSAWRRAEAGQGGHTSICGEAGCGKSRLVKAFRDQALIGDSSILQINCAPQKAFSAFAPILSGLRSFLNNVETGPVVPQILTELLQGSSKTSVEISAQERRRDAIQACTAILTSLNSEEPFLLIAEDLQWSDPSTLDVLRELTRRLADKRLLLLTTERAQREPERVLADVTKTIRLDRLSDVALSDLIRSLAGEKLSQDSIDAIARRADGIPLFAEQLALSMLESSPGEAEISVPDSLRSTLVSRLDRLGNKKSVALAASIIGRRFSRDALMHVSDVQKAEINVGLQALQIAGLIQPDGTEFMFSHALVRDAAYGSLLRDDRRNMHGRLAAWLQTMGMDSPSEVLAHHLQEAGDHQKAADAWENAADAARTRFAQVEAAELYSRALEQDKIATGGERELDLLMLLGEAQFAALGGAAEATQATFRRAVTLAKRSGREREQYAALYGVWVGKIISGGYDDAMSCAQQMMGLADKSADPGIRIAALRIRCAPLLLSGDLENAIADAEMAIALAKAHNIRKIVDFAHDPLATLGSTYAQALWALGAPTKALQIARDSVEDCVATGQSVNTICYTRVWEMILLAQSRLSEPLSNAAVEVQRFAEKTGSAFWENLGNWGLGYSKILQGDFSEGAEIAEKCVDRFMSTGARQQAPLFIISVAEGKFKCGDTERAIEYLELADTVIQTTNQNYFEPLRLRTKSMILRELGSFEEAREVRSRLVDAVRKMGAKTWLESDPDIENWR